MRLRFHRWFAAIATAAAAAVATAGAARAQPDEIVDPWSALAIQEGSPHGPSSSPRIFAREPAKSVQLPSRLTLRDTVDPWIAPATGAEGPPGADQEADPTASRLEGPASAMEPELVDPWRLSEAPASSPAKTSTDVAPTAPEVIDPWSPPVAAAAPHRSPQRTVRAAIFPAIARERDQRALGVGAAPTRVAPTSVAIFPLEPTTP